MAGCDSNSSATSLEDQSEEFEENPTRDTLTEVEKTREAQAELKDQIEALAAELKNISDQQSCPVDLESYISKLNISKKRVVVVQNILSSAQDRLNKVHQNCLK
ncbi:uncharacterized protein LOC111702603 [Eurytemora carolleeae]|uniref:uncharacterized protein LOC111702603 n=1 Tax=Eurytemora carolleeae TaxID=1294199 RepID=UPI000C76D900|nr:uncharacterized protein LOC111702603 [Eurytemora carolleeae]|eukprot:XP_023330112.1 uncharacterized protein LOC111702603 [Eurytemora affinis]